MQTFSLTESLEGAIAGKASMAPLRLLTGLFLLPALGCSAPVTESQVVGAWVLSDEARSQLPPVSQKAAGRVQLNADGSFVAEELPGELVSSIDEHWAMGSGAGVWKLVSGQGGQEVRLRFRMIRDALPGRVPYETQLFVSRTSRSVVLFYYEGDPDSGVRIEFHPTSPRER